MELTYAEVLEINNPGLSQMGKIDTGGDPKLFLFLLEVKDKVKKYLRNYQQAQIELIRTYGYLDKDDNPILAENGRELKFQEPAEEKKREYLKAMKQLNEETVEFNVKPLPMSHLQGKDTVSMQSFETIWKFVDQDK